MKKNKFGKSVLTTAIVSSMGLFALAGCSTGAGKEVLRVGMECAYAPFNWTQDEETTPDGSKAVKIYDSTFYAYGYDVAVSQMIADQLGMELEIHKVEWSSIGISLDAGDYDCIIAGMGRTKEREMSYSFTTPYYYRDNLLDQIDGAVTGSNYETTSECFMAVSNGVADICIVDLPTAQSALLTNKDLKIITFDENDSFSGDEEMVNVCIATRKSDTALRDKIQGAMDALGWSDKAKMDDLMAKVIGQQPAASSAPAEAELMIDIAIFGKEDYFIA